MGQPLLHQGAGILCPHGGQVQLAGFSARVRVGGQPVAVQNPRGSVAGCPFTVTVGPATVLTPCIGTTWMTAAQRVKAGGQPVLLQSSQSLCENPVAPGPAAVQSCQSRVRGA